MRPRVGRPFSRDERRALVRGVADRAHGTTDSLVTVGGGRVKFAAEWSDPAYGLDVVQIHLYPNIRHPRRDREYLMMARDGGYLGAWPWSFKGVDDFGAMRSQNMRSGPRRIVRQRSTRVRRRP